MLKKVLATLLVAMMLLTSVASAEMSNRDYQLMGGVAVTDGSDVYFFCPMEEGNTAHWGLYSVNTMADGPIYEITNGYPAKLVHATEKEVFFLGYTNADRDVYALYSLDLSKGTTTALLEDISATFVGDEDDFFFYVKEDEPYTLYTYDISKEKSVKLKDMSKSSKTIYDAMIYEGDIFFTTRDTVDLEDSYEYHESSGKATNLSKASPTVVFSVLHEGYQVYANDGANTRIYSVEIGEKKATQIGKKYSCSLNNPRYGDAIYCYDSEHHALVRCPLDGSAETSLELTGDILSRLLVFGDSEDLLFYADGAVYAAPASLSSSTRLFDFSLASGGQVWCYLVPAGDYVIAMGYGTETYTHMSNMMPTGVQVFERATGNVVFEYPIFEEGAPVEGADSDAPTSLGADEVITEENEETIFF